VGQVVNVVNLRADWQSAQTRGLPTHAQVAIPMSLSFVIVAHALLRAASALMPTLGSSLCAVWAKWVLEAANNISPLNFGVANK